MPGKDEKKDLSKEDAEALGRMAQEIFREVERMLIGATDVARECEVLAARAPHLDTSLPMAVNVICSVCPANPARMFEYLRETAAGEPWEFHVRFLEVARVVERFHRMGVPTPYCGSCLVKTADDFEYLFLVFQRFAREVQLGRWTVVRTSDEEE